jgi:acetyl-CoA acetyltransferase
MSRGWEGVAVACPVTIPYARTSDRAAHWWLGRALRALVDTSGLAKREIDGLIASAFTLGPDTSVALAEHFGLTPRYLDWLPTGGASGTMALRRAARAVQAGDANVVACIAGDTARPGGFAALVAEFSRFSAEAVWPYGEAGPNLPFALITDNYLRTTGTAPEALAAIPIASRANAAANPNALLRHKPLDLAAWRASPMIVDPLRRDDCVMPCAGAEGFLVMDSARAAGLGLPHARILASIERHNAFAEDPVATRGGWAMDAHALWAQASCGPGDMDCVQTYDDYPVIVAMQFEGLGLCLPGEGGRFAAATDLRVGGALPHNTGGGQLGCGQAGAAGGFLGVVEALRQLTRQPLGAQVEGARTALVSGYGMVTFDRCVASAAAVLAAS